MRYVIVFLALLPTATGQPAPRIMIDGAPRTIGAWSAGAGEAGIAALDFNRDGHADLAVISMAKNDLTLLAGDGRGGLQAAGTYPAGRDPTDIAAADLDGDGSTELVIANHETDEITVLQSDGGRIRPAAQSPLRIRVDPHPHAVRLADLDGDGLQDLAVDHREGGGLLVLRGAQGGHFSGPGVLIGLGGDPYREFAIGDLNGDGKPDLVAPNPRGISIAMNRSGDALGFDQPVTLPGPRPFAVALADLDADGHPDIIAASDAAGPLTILKGDGRGRFRSSGDAPRMAAGAKRVAIGDLNGDGVDDAVIGGWSPTMLVILGSKARIRTESLTIPGIEHPWGLAIADLDGDGHGDVIVADGESDRLVVLLSGTRRRGGKFRRRAQKGPGALRCRGLSSAREGLRTFA